MSFTNRKIAGYITISEVIMHYKNEIGDFSMTDYLRYFGILIRGITEITKSRLTNIEVVRLTPDSINCLNLPDDYMKYVKVGIIINERIQIIPPNNNIVIPDSEVCGEPYRDTSTSNANITGDDNIVYFAPHFWEGNYNPALYGAVGGYSDVYFKEDRPNNRLVLEGTLPTGYEFIVEYISSGIDATGQTMIPRECLECLLAWLRWRLDVKNIDFMRLYGIERDRLRDFRYMFDRAEYENAMYRSIKQSVKR